MMWDSLLQKTIDNTVKNFEKQKKANEDLVKRYLSNACSFTVAAETPTKYLPYR